MAGDRHRRIALVAIVAVLAVVALFRWHTVLRMETPEEALTTLRGEVPAGYAFAFCDPYVLAYDVSAASLSDVTQALARTSAGCRAVIGRGGRRVAPVKVYYGSSIEEYRGLYRKVFDQDPTSDLGICAPSSRRLFGSAAVGPGTLTHETVHILIMDDWPDLPGWFNESLAVTLGCPVVGMVRGKYRVSDLHLYVGILTVKKGKWTPLGETLRHGEADYGKDETVEVEAGNGLVGVVGPLATGRLFVRWLNETGNLPRFYRAYRDTRDPAAALRSAVGQDVAGADAKLREWILSHDEAALISEIQGR